VLSVARTFPPTSRSWTTGWEVKAVPPAHAPDGARDTDIAYGGPNATLKEGVFTVTSVAEKSSVSELYV
jgi:hypothetical protein